MEFEREMSLYGRTDENTPRILRAEKKKRNILNRQKIIVTVFLIMFIGIGILLTPVFNVKKITVNGNNYLSTDKILEISTAKTDKNIFLFTKSDAERKISELSFVDEVSVDRIFPSEVSITIKECTPIAQVMCGQSLYLIIDKNGKILDTAGNIEKYAVPVITDMEISEFEVSKNIVTSDRDNLNKMLVLLRELSQNGLMDSVTNVYSGGNELHAVFNKNIDCNFGYEDNLSYRVKFVRECLGKIPEGQGGEIRFMEDYKAVFTKESEESEQ